MKIRGGWLAGLGLVAALAVPAGALGATTLGSPLLSSPEAEAACGAGTFTNTKLAAGTLIAPFDGVIAGWRLAIASPGGAFAYKLRVLAPKSGGKYEGVATGPGQLAPLAGVNVMALPQPIAIKAGDIIAVDCPEGAPPPYANKAPGGTTYAYFAPPLADGKTASPNNQISTDEELINADLIGAPTIVAVTPASGPSVGGQSVAITGARLGDLSAVSFGGVPASGLVSVSETEVRATAPAHAPGVVDVEARNLAGNSVAPGAFTYLASLRLSAVSESNKVWRAGNRIAGASAAKPGGPPVGTKFSFALSEAASISFAFGQKTAGRKVKGRCVAPTKQNTGHGACKRLRPRGSLIVNGKSGANSVSFQGRISKSRKLGPGSYSVAIKAHATLGGDSASKSLSFRIVK